MNFDFIISIIFLLFVVFLPDTDGFVCKSTSLFISSPATRSTKSLSSANNLYTTARKVTSSSSLDEGLSNNNNTRNNDNYVDPTSRFHSDMRRVLDSRKEAFEASSNSSVSMDRRKRPGLLNKDIDGVDRVTSMLRHMVNIGVANEETYQIVLEALCKRGRLRWYDDDSIIVCAADVVEGIYDEAWNYLYGKVSTRTCNLVLQAYATCSTPRGNRQYAEKAQAILDEMEDEGIDPSVESFTCLVNAWAWQQGNRGSGKCVDMAEKNIKKLLEFSPDNATKLQAYHFVLEAWSKVCDEDAPAQADRILNEMKLIRRTLNNSTTNLPNSESYTNAILTWTKSNAAERAHDLLYECIDNFENYIDNLDDGDKISSDMEPELFAFSKFRFIVVFACLQYLN